MNQLEAKIRDNLASRLEIIEKGLSLVDTEFVLNNSYGASGRIDILARDFFGNYVVIEIKRSDQTARQALHELFKYISIIQRQLGISSTSIRAMLISTAWNELTVPFSEFLEIAPCHTEGFKIEVDLEGTVLLIERFSAMTLASPLLISRCQSLHLYRRSENRNKYINQISFKLNENGINDHVLLSIDHDKSNEKVMFPYGTYVLFSSPFLLLNDEERNSLKEKISWDDELDEPDENFLVAYCDEFSDHDTMEIGTPEKLRLISESWEINVAVRSGRFKSNTELLTDKHIIALATQLEGGSPHYLYLTTSPRFRDRWNQLLNDVEWILRGNRHWELSVPEILNQIASRDLSANISISLYNIANTHYALCKMCSGDFDYFPVIEVISQESDGLRIYRSSVRWNMEKINISPERFFEITCGDPFSWLTAQHFGSQHEFDDSVRTVIGLDTPIIEFYIPPAGDYEINELFLKKGKISYRTMIDAPIAGPAELYGFNKDFFYQYRAFLSEQVTGLF